MREKLINWESSFDAIVRDYYTKPFIWGSSDCLCFTADLVQCQSGIDILRGNREKYSTEREAYAALKRIGGSLESPFIYFEPVEKSFARRGDAGIAWIDSGPTFGVVGLDNKKFLLKSPSEGVVGLPFRKSAPDMKLWRIRCQALYSELQ